MDTGRGREMEAKIILRREIEPGDWAVLCIEGNSYVLFTEDAEDLQALLSAWYEAIPTRGASPSPSHSQSNEVAK